MPRFSYLESWIETFAAGVFVSAPLNVIISGKAFADRSLNLPDIVMFVPPTATYPYTTSRDVTIYCPITVFVLLVVATSKTAESFAFVRIA